MVTQSPTYDIEVNDTHPITKGYSPIWDRFSYRYLTDLGKYWLNANDHYGRLDENTPCHRTSDIYIIRYLAGRAKKDGLKVLFLSERLDD